MLIDDADTLTADAPTRALRQRRLPQRQPRQAPNAREAARPHRPALFIDKDGTLLEDLPFNVDPARIRFMPHAIEALKLLQAFDFSLVVVTNQPGIAQGRFTQADLDRLERGLTEQLARQGVHLAGFYACPHAPAERGGSVCTCRKPAPGLIQRACQTLSLDPLQSWMVGDILDDIEAGRRAGCSTALLDVGNETMWRHAPLRVPHLRASNLFDLARSIVAIELEKQRWNAQQTAALPN